jgi:hypothetical protein
VLSSWHFLLLNSFHQVLSFPLFLHFKLQDSCCILNLEIIISYLSFKLLFKLQALTFVAIIQSSSFVVTFELQ